MLDFFKRPLVLVVVLLVLLDVVSIQIALQRDNADPVVARADAAPPKPVAARPMAVNPPSVVTTDGRKPILVESPPQVIAEPAQQMLLQGTQPVGEQEVQQVQEKLPPQSDASPIPGELSVSPEATPSGRLPTPVVTPMPGQSPPPSIPGDEPVPIPPPTPPSNPDDPTTSPDPTPQPPEESPTPQPPDESPTPTLPLPPRPLPTSPSPTVPVPTVPAPVESPTLPALLNPVG